MRPTGGTTASVATAACLVLAPAWVLSQEVPDAGSRMRELQPPAVQLPAAPPREVGVEQPGQPAAPGPSAVRFRLAGFRITGSTVWAESALLELVSDLVGRDVGFEDLRDAAARITGFYREHGYIVARAYLPAQDIVDGTVEIAVLEGRYGELQLDNGSRVGDEVVGGYLDRATRGPLIHEPALERALLLLADLAGTGEQSASLRPGRQVGESELKVTLGPQPLLRGRIGYNNFGNRSTGRDRVAGAMDLVSPLRRGDLLSAQGIREFPGLDFVRVSYDLPLGSSGLRAGVAYARLDYELGDEFAVLDPSGDAHSWAGEVSYPIVRSRRFTVNVLGELGYLDRHDVIGATETVTDRDNLLATAALSGYFHDGFLGEGVNAFRLSLGRGDLDIRTADAAAIDAVTLRTEGGYWKWNLDVLRQQRLTDAFSLYLSLRAQKASGNLDSSQEILIGGPYAVRAFTSDEAAGDSGYALTGELRYRFRSASLPGEFQLAGFFDTGRIKVNEDPFAAGDNHRRLSAAGLALGWEDPGNFHVRTVFAHRVGGAKSRVDPGDDGTIWIEAAKHF